MQGQVSLPERILIKSLRFFWLSVMKRKGYLHVLSASPGNSAGPETPRIGSGQWDGIRSGLFLDRRRLGTRSVRIACWFGAASSSSNK